MMAVFILSCNWYKSNTFYHYGVGLLLFFGNPITSASLAVFIKLSSIVLLSLRGWHGNFRLKEASISDFATALHCMQSDFPLILGMSDNILFPDVLFTWKQTISKPIVTVFLLNMFDTSIFLIYFLSSLAIIFKWSWVFLVQLLCIFII